jgi:hypothetical protein
MSLREGIAATVGASLSFALGLVATAEDPTPILGWGLGISFALLIIFVLAEFVRSPWLRVHITVLDSDAFVVRYGFENPGRRALSRQIVNILVPDDVHFERTSADGGRYPDQREIGNTPESLDGVRASAYWHEAIEFVPGSWLLHLRYQTDRTELPVMLHIGGKRRRVVVERTPPDNSYIVNFAKVRPLVTKRPSSVSRKR